MANYCFKFPLFCILPATLLVTCAAFSVPAHHQIEPYIINGLNSTRGQFPFYAFFRTYINGVDYPVGYCGGNIISDEWILTAAHCVDGVSLVEVHLGVLTLEELNEPGRIVMNSTEIIVHSNYILKIFLNDIALIRLPRKIEFSETIQPVKLPSPCDRFKANNRVFAIGFGVTNTTEIYPPHMLQWAELNIVSNWRCSIDFPFIFRRRSIICANGSQRESICYGDSGGPLVDADSRKLIGATSFLSWRGCHRGRPQAFTALTEYLDWIQLHSSITVPECPHP